MLWFNQIFTKICLLNGTVSQVSDVTNGSLVFIFRCQEKRQLAKLSAYERQVEEARAETQEELPCGGAT